MSYPDIYLGLLGLLEPQKITLVAHPDKKVNDNPPQEEPDQQDCRKQGVRSSWDAALGQEGWTGQEEVKRGQGGDEVEQETVISAHTPGRDVAMDLGGNWNSSLEEPQLEFQPGRISNWNSSLEKPQLEFQPERTSTGIPTWKNLKLEFHLKESQTGIPT
ncbi:hypothetical protein WISP_30573 [Willisornis vidua]|uniref:Uncharacterized protein n=1 Tax=Willisornis vidua TaxID=1566151 RepID=A0ABQ9DKA0_9PASS|nr:hypothetical protein WISP_30573 [Willisornis vidua]